MRTLLWAFGALLVLAPACSPTDPRFGSVTITATGPAAQVCTDYDANHDGTLTAAEVRQALQNTGQSVSDADVTEVLETCSGIHGSETEQ